MCTVAILENYLSNVSVTFYWDPTGHYLYKYSGKYLTNNNNILLRSGLTQVKQNKEWLLSFCTILQND